MSSIQERLQLKRVPLDTWSIREQLCLASAVVRSGDQNWMSVSRALKTIGETNRPQDWYSQKSCAAQYGVLLENVETPKRKKRSSESAVETPQESILKKLTQERIVEIQKTLAEMNQQYELLKNEVAEIRNPNTSEDRLREMWNSVEAAKRARERESAKRAAWLKEREEKHARAEKTWRPPSQPVTSTECTSPAAPAPSSPLLTSLLKSSPVVTTPQHISHPANVVESVSPSAGAPTLSMLLEQPGSRPSVVDNKHAAIEHIKSQLFQIEKRLKARPAPLDIDDIEIKEEDVYAFRDIDLNMQPTTPTVTHRTPEKQEPPKTDVVEESTPVAMETSQDNSQVIIEDTVKEEAVSKPVESTNVTIEDITIVEPPPAQRESQQQDVTSETPPEVKISFPDSSIKFPTTEIKVIQPDVEKIKEEKDPEIQPQETHGDTTAPSNMDAVEENMEIDIQTPTVEDIVPAPSIETQEEQATPSIDVEVKQEVVLPSEAALEENEDKSEEQSPPTPPVPVPEPEPEPEPVPKQEVPAEVTQEQTDTQKEEPNDEETKDDTEDSVPLNEMIKEEISKESGIKQEKKEVEENHTETDDDAPMELSREEEKDGKKKKDYSRKKKSDSRTCSGSESAAETSAPESPGAPGPAGGPTAGPTTPAHSGDLDRAQRLWKKSVMLVYSRLCAHKYASIFSRPISDEEAPGYTAAVRRPMDLSTIRRNIDSGAIRTTAEFHRDVLLMLMNALMYNSTAHSVHAMARDMFNEAQSELGMLVAAQAHAGLCQPPPTRKRRAPL